MANYQYYLKDKKISVWEYTTTKVNGITSKVWAVKYPDLWAYYKQLSGSASLAGSAIKIYDSTERATFVINRLTDLDIKMVIRFNNKVYKLLQIDDYEGYTEDLKITGEYDSSGQYPGMD